MNTLFWGALCLLLCAPGLKTAPRVVVLAALLYGLNDLLVMLPAWWWDKLSFGLQFNWLGKALAILLVGLIIYGWRWVSPQAAGLQPPQPGSGQAVGLVMLGVALAQLATGYTIRHQLPHPGLEALLYQATMPGLAEELFYRGVLLDLLNQVFPRTIPFLGTRTSWGGVAGVILFILGHCLYFTQPDTLLPITHFTLGKVADKLLFGGLFLWVRERSSSVWMAVATHNLASSCLVLGHLLPL